MIASTGLFLARKPHWANPQPTTNRRAHAETRRHHRQGTGWHRCYSAIAPVLVPETNTPGLSFQNESRFHERVETLGANIFERGEERRGEGL